IVAEALDDPEFPERLVAIEALREEAACELLQLLVPARRRKRGVAHVELEIELGVVDPYRPPDVERHEREPLAVARDAIEARGDQVDQVAVRGRRSLEDGDRADMHVRG